MLGMVFKALTVRIKLDSSEFSRGLQQATTSMDQFGKRMTDVGNTLALRVTAPILAMGVAIARTAGDFEAAMLRVQALSGATAGELQKLEAAALHMGATTAFSSSDAADALGFMSMAGMRAADQLEALPGVLTLAASAGLDMATSADIVTNVLAGMGMEVGELGRLNDVLVRTFTRTNTSLQQLGEAMKYVAPVAAAARVEVEDVAAAIGLMGNAGIQGSMAGTSLRSAISRLLSPTQQISEALAGAGVAVERTAEGGLDLIGTLRNLEPHANNVALLMTVFGQRAGPGMAAILSQGTDALEAFTLELELAEGTAQRIADSRMQGFNGALANAESAVEALGLAIADSGFLDSVTEMVNQFTEFTQTLAGLNPEILRAATNFAAIAATIPVLIIAVGTLVRTFVFLLGALAGPAGVVMLLAGVATAVPIWQRLEAAVRGANRAMEDTRDLTSELTGLMAQFASATGEAREQLRELTLARIEDLGAQAANAQAEAASAANRVSNQSFWDFAMGGGLWGRSSAATAADEAQAYADNLQQQFLSALSNFLDADIAPELARRFDEAWSAYRAARDESGGFTADERRAWLQANPQYADILRRGGQLQRIAAGEGGEYDPTASAAAGDRPPPSIERANTLASLERINQLAPATRDELDLLNEVQAEYNASIEYGEQANEAQIEQWVRRVRALREEIDARVELNEVQKDTQRHIDAQEELTEAALRGERAYRVAGIALELMARNQALARDEAYRLAEAQDAANERHRDAVQQMSSVASFADNMGRAFANALERAIIAGESLSDVLKSLAQDILAMVARLLIVEPIARRIVAIIRSLTGGGSSNPTPVGGGGGKGGGSSSFMGNFLSQVGSSLFAGFFAEGGFIPPGKWGIAGERGAEPVYGGKTGATVVPASGSAPYVDNRVYQFQGTGAEIAEFRRAIAQLDRSVEGRAFAVVANERRRGRL